jgi:hypothetical protein
LTLDVSSLSAPDRASPPMDSEAKEEAALASPPHQNGHEVQIPVRSPHIAPSEPPLHQIPSTERETDMKV